MNICIMMDAGDLDEYYDRLLMRELRGSWRRNASDLSCRISPTQRVGARGAADGIQPDSP